MKFRLVDKIVAYTPGRCISGQKAVSFEEYSLRTRLNMDIALPESLALGALLELANWLAILSSDFRDMTLPEQIEEVTFHRALCPGERLSLHVDLLRRDADQFVFSGRATIGGEPTMEVKQWQAAIAPLSECHDPSDLRVLYSEIGVPAT